MSRPKLLLILAALALAVGCGLSPVPDLPSLQPGSDDPDFAGSGGTSAASGGDSATGGGPSFPSGGDAPDQNLGGALNDASLMGGFGGER